MSQTVDTDLVITRGGHWALPVRCSSETYFVTLSLLPSELPLVCHRVGCPWLGQPLTHPVLFLELKTFRPCAVAHLEQDKEPWEPERVDISPYTAQEDGRGSGSHEWELEQR